MTGIFKFKEQQVRVIGSAEKPWWVGKDICDVLDISKYRDALARLDEDERCPSRERTASKLLIQHKYYTLNR